MKRAATLALLALVAAAPPRYPEVHPGVALAFPRDGGAHPAFRTEWWYVTGTVSGADGRQRGFQVTFFRTRPGVAEGEGGAFAPTQILFAHAALSDPAIGHLLHGERAARAGLGLAAAATGDTDVWLHDWRLQRLPDGSYRTTVTTPEFALALQFRPTQPPLLQGQGGYSRKGPRPEQASYYYSLPHLVVSGQVRQGKHSAKVTGTAWMDREWSSDYLAPQAVGWDWTGLNLADGGALMAFRIRRRDGSTLWAGGALRRADGRVTSFAPDAVQLDPVRWWRSPRTGARYPVVARLSVNLPEGRRQWLLRPLFPDQELDGRGGGLPVYWEGAVRTTGGSGYLELTGYVAPLSL